jgi:hypothetical protein
MLHKDILIEKGALGTNGYAFDINGASVPNISSEVPVYFNFDRSLPPIGTALIYKKGDALYANINLTANIPSGSILYPCIGASYNPADFKRKKKLVTKFIVNNLSLCSMKNSDETIPPITI